MKKRNITFSILFISLVSQLCLGQQNPILRDVDSGFLYVADPAAEVYNDKVYVYCSHDDPQATNYSTMKDYIVLESDDMINWTNHGVVISPREYSWASGQMNAPDAAYKDGWYYLYFPYDKTHIGVAKSRNPEGPWEEAVTDKITTIFDPTVIVDDDGQAYIYGNDHKVDLGATGAHIMGAKLKDNMIELDGDWVRLSRETVNEAVHVFKRNGIYYFNARVGTATNYWMSDKPLPTVADGYATSKGQLAPNATDAPNHASAIEFKGQWYFFYQRGDVNNGNSFKRSAAFEKMYFNNDGSIRPITYTLDPNYVEKGTVDPPNTIEETLNFAEADVFFPNDGSEVVVENAGDNIGSVLNGNYVEFNNVNFLKHGDYTVTINAAHKGAKSALGAIAGTVEIFINGDSKGVVEIEDTGNWSSYKNFNQLIKIPENLVNPSDIKFLFSPAGAETYAENFATVSFNYVAGTGGDLLSNKDYSLSDFSIYPTLTDNELIIDRQNKSISEYTIFNLNGQVIKLGTLNSGKTNLDVSVLKSGLYLLKLKNKYPLVKFVKK